ncbi:MAG: DUF2085 domain-containing protein [Deltaproteobacteria bacterium]|nr:DUF2085 domain-containing protein [Deltaproteobacteria bacterium]
MGASDVQMALGWWICHQDPSRSLSLGGVILPLCARCSGIYLFLGICLWAGLLAGRPSGSRSLAIPAAAAAAGCAALLGQWTGAQLGLWTSTPLSRVLTGIVCGGGIGWLLHTAFGLRLLGRQQRRWPAAVAFGASSGGFLLLLLLGPPWTPAAHFVGAASLAGFFSTGAWIQAILLSFVITDRDGSPRRLIIAAIVIPVVILEAVAMSVIRI